MRIRDLVHSVRQNHALEHATVHVLSRVNPYVQIMGRSTDAGFFIYGAVSTQEVASAATEALARLQQGEYHLARIWLSPPSCRGWRPLARRWAALDRGSNDFPWP